MFSLGVDCFGSRLLFLRQHWKSDSAVGRLLQQAFECFQMDVGLDGNIFNRSFSTLGHLASHSWFKSLWEFCDYYSVDFSFSEDMNINFLREGDKALMECFLLCGVFTIDQLRTLNRVRKYKKVHFLSEILLCDGRMVKPSMMNQHEGHSTRIYSRERPRRKDLDLRCSALREITSPTLS